MSKDIRLDGRRVVDHDINGTPILEGRALPLPRYPLDGTRASKIIYFKERTPTPLKVVKDKGGGCAPCFFKGQPGGCPEKNEEIRAGAGYGCLRESHHYVEHECAS